MALIDSSYFVGPINIPNTNIEPVSERLQWFIDKYEPEFLEVLMGYELYKAFAAGTADYDGDGSNSTIDVRWLNLIEGSEYVRSNKPRKFKGLVHEQGSTFFSMIANYVYWYWTRDGYTQTTGVGEVESKSENADVVNPADKMIKAWNEMSEEIYDLYYYMQANAETYPEWISFNKERMLYKFRKVNAFGF